MCGKEVDLRQWDTLVFKGEHAENEHWRLVEDRTGQVRAVKGDSQYVSYD